MSRAHCSKTCRLAGSKCSPDVVNGELAQVRTLRRLTAEVRQHGEDAPCSGGWVSVRSVCLLIAMFQVVPGAPLIVAANRDERLDRPAVPMTVLRERDPRILGGRDELAGGTWLAVNEHGVVAGLTNQPSPDGRDPAKRSRGELPLAFARYQTAATAVSAVRAELDPTAYNPCWMLVGDRESLHFIGISGGSSTDVEQLEPGLHVLENAPLHPVSAKAAFVRGLVTDALARLPGDGAGDPATTVSALKTVLGDHQPAVPEPRTDPTGRVWPAFLVGRVRPRRRLRHPVGDDRQRLRGDRSPCRDGRRRATVRTADVRCDRPVGAARPAVADPRVLPPPTGAVARRARSARGVSVPCQPGVYSARRA